MNDHDDDRLSPAEERVAGHLAVLRDGGPAAREDFDRGVVRTVRWQRAVRGQLGGTVERHWEPSGLVVEVAVPLARATTAGDPHAPRGGAEAVQSAA